MTATCPRCGHPAQRDPDDGVLYIAEPRRISNPTPEPHARPADTTTSTTEEPRL